MTTDAQADAAIDYDTEALLHSLMFPAIEATAPLLNSRQKMQLFQVRTLHRFQSQ